MSAGHGQADASEVCRLLSHIGGSAVPSAATLRDAVGQGVSNASERYLDALQRKGSKDDVANPEVFKETMDLWRQLKVCLAAAMDEAMLLKYAGQ